MSAERLYRLLLRAYPPAFRAEYGREMLLLFRGQCRDGDVWSIGFWAVVIYDVARSAPALHAEEWRGRRTANTLTIEASMKLAAILMLLVGVVGILNGVIEWVGGGTGTTSHLLAMVLAVGASALLLVAGAAMMRPGSRGLQVGRWALFASVVMILAARLLHPWMSPFAQLVGIGLPIVLLIALYWPGRTSSAGAA